MAKKQNSVDSDTVTAIFNVDKPNALTIDNFTTYSIERDFFVPADAFHFTIEDDRADQLNNKIQIGSPLTIQINDCIQLVGYVEKMDFRYSRGSGSVLSISGRDKLGLMADAIVPPNNNYGPNTTIKHILTELFKRFDIEVADDSVSDSIALSMATAGNVAEAKRNKTKKIVAKSWLRELNRQIKPRKEEGYLQYAIRLTKQLGLHIKLLPGTNTLFVNTPIYDRDSQPLYKLTNIEKVFGSTTKNNIINGSLTIDWTEQPSIIIAEKAGSQQPEFRIEVEKCIAINEITAMNMDGSLHTEVDEIITNLSKTLGSSFGTPLLPFNQDLIAALPTLVLNQGEVVQTIARPAYLFDEHGTSKEDLEFFVLTKLAEKQTKFLSLDYEVQGHSYNGKIWNPNLMVEVHDDKLNILDQSYWLQKTIFTKSRNEGTKTKLLLRLPYVYSFYTLK